MTSKTPQDIFGDTVRGGYGVDDDDEWVTVPVNLIPGKMDNQDRFGGISRNI